MTRRDSSALKPMQIELLRAVIAARCPDRPDLLYAISGADLSRKQREELVDVILEEFAVTGLGPDSEPNPRGLALEDLIDAVNRPNLLDEQ
jgi:hypothetical protein